MLSSIGYIRLWSVTNKKINDMLDPAYFSVNPVCTNCEHNSDSVRVDLKYLNSFQISKFWLLLYKNLNLNKILPNIWILNVFLQNNSFKNSA